MTVSDDRFVRLFQERAATSGFYTGRIDGIAGPGTLQALANAFPALVVISEPPVSKPDDADAIPDAGDKKLAGVHNALVSVIRMASLRSPVKFTVTEGLRTKERQAQLVKQGASKTHNSRHLTGHAVDLWPLDANGKSLPSDAQFPRGSAAARKADADLWAGLRTIAATVKEVAKEQGVQIEWGGDWGWDAPHFQLNRASYPA